MRIILACLLRGASAGCGGDDAGEAADGTEAATTTEAPATTTSTTTTTMAPTLEDLARSICVDFSIEYAAVGDGPVVRQIFVNDERLGYYVMPSAETPYATAAAELEALDIADAEVAADAQRLIDALTAADEANAAYLENNSTVPDLVEALRTLEATATELDLVSCGMVKIAEQ